MKTRATEWLDTKTMTTVYGFQIHHDGRWLHVAENGHPLVYDDQSERDEKRAEYRKRRSPHDR